MSRRIIGVSRQTYPSEIHQPAELACVGNDAELRRLCEQHTVVVVLVAGGVNDYAAYAGFGSLEWIAANGDKLSFNMARGHFPGIVEEKYRV